MDLGIGYIALVLVIVLFSMTFHEAMHAFAGHWLGDDTAKVEGRLTLNPLAHIDPFLTIGLPLFLAIASVVTQTPIPIFGGAKPVPFNPGRVRYGDFGAAIVGVAGPLTNLVFAFIAFGIMAVFGLTTGLTATVLATTILVNLGFFIFNMLPIPPLDGSRVLYAIAPEPVRRVMEVIEQYGLIFIFALVLLFSAQLGQIIIAIRDIILAAFSAIFGVSMV
ncbi:site-2 protease family protein [Pedobacter sp.]|nr:site-2 protease family protein [Candidatus Saccharibacteria bacterium]